MDLAVTMLSEIGFALIWFVVGALTIAVGQY